MAADIIESNIKCGLLAKKLAHTFSPLIHSRLASYSYALFEKEEDEVEAFIRSDEWDAINVTIPYKKTALALCDELSPTAVSAGSVNTLIHLEDGRIKGFNTDYYGFEYILRRAGFDVSSGKILVLGSGGSSGMVRAVLKDMGASLVVTVSRTGDDNYENLYERHADAKYIINTTPVGMFPENGKSAVDINMFPGCKGVIDLIYNPSKTKLLLDAESAGIKAVNGLAMLVAQAKKACEIFTGSEIDDGVIDSITAEIEAATKNVILIGMPGCGKSTIGSELAQELNRPFVDIDMIIEERIGMSICDFFKAEGEPAFRVLETEVLSEYSRKSGQIIATGGGVVKSAHNLPLLKQNGTIVMINRPLHELPVAGRPISMSCDLVHLERERLPIYRAWNDVSIKAGTPEDTTRSIIETLELKRA